MPWKAMLHPDASAEEMVNATWHLPRDLVSDGFDAALEAFAQVVPMKVHRYPSGTRCWDWIVPEKWTCHEAYVETLDGRRLFTYQDTPLHVASYSQSVDKVVSREELLARTRAHHGSADAVPFLYHFYDRAWSISMSRRQRDALEEDRYRVVIRSGFSYGELKVGEVVLPGRSRDCIVLCAHLDHPGQVNDGLSGVVVGVDVMRALARLPRREYTYRLLILPETIGSTAWLSQHEHLIPRLRGGIFLEMLGLDQPHTLQRSHAGNTVFDRVVEQAFRRLEPDGRVGDFLKVVTNDERQFNAPGVGVPMVGLSRVENFCVDGPCFTDYHTSFDDPKLTSAKQLEGSRDLVLDLLAAWEAAAVPRNRFRGEPFLSRHGIHFDFENEAAESQALFEVMFMLNGHWTLDEIAAKLQLPVEVVTRIATRFRERGLVDLPGVPSKP